METIIARGVVKGLNRYFAQIALGVLILYVAVKISGYPAYDDTDAPNEHSGLKVLTDAKSGCQYLSTSNGGLTPRLDAKGSHVCR